MAHFITISAEGTSQGRFHSYLVGAIAPRPIALASTLSASGQPNLAPFSFFNVFSSNPPVVILAPNRSGRTGRHKHTYLNLKATGELVINVVSYAMVQQASLASVEYAEAVNEFDKAGFTPLASERVKPARVQESPVQLECSVRQVIELGQEGGAGNLVICDVLLMHLNKAVLDAENRIEPHQLDLVGRMGGDWYCRAVGQALFTVPKPVSSVGIGVDALPAPIRLSRVLTGNDLGQLGNVEALPLTETVQAYARENERSLKLLQSLEAYQRRAQRLLAEGKLMDAWCVLLLSLTL